jgi:hypothetical protein
MLIYTTMHYKVHSNRYIFARDITISLMKTKKLNNEFRKY